MIGYFILCMDFSSLDNVLCMVQPRPVTITPIMTSYNYLRNLYWHVLPLSINCLSVVCLFVCLLHDFLCLVFLACLLFKWIFINIDIADTFMIYLFLFTFQLFTFFNSFIDLYYILGVFYILRGFIFLWSALSVKCFRIFFRVFMYIKYCFILTIHFM